MAIKFCRQCSATTFLLCGLLLALHIPALALPDDRHQAIEIQSHRAVREEKTGLTVYEGDVSIKQGSILIRADKVSVYTLNRKVSRIVCTGRPAQYQQRPQADSGLVIARASTIEYDLNEDRMHLVGNASLEQAEATLSGERIDYDLKQELIRAQGGSGEGNRRIKMVIPPSQQQEAQ